MNIRAMFDKRVYPKDKDRYLWIVETEQGKCVYTSRWFIIALLKCLWLNMKGGE